MFRCRERARLTHREGRRESTAQTRDALMNPRRAEYKCESPTANGLILSPRQDAAVGRCNLIGSQTGGKCCGRFTLRLYIGHAWGLMSYEGALWISAGKGSMQRDMIGRATAALRAVQQVNLFG